MVLTPCKPLPLERQSMNASSCRPRRQASVLLSKRLCTWMEGTASPAAAMQRLRLKPCASTPLSRPCPLMQQLSIARKPQTPGFSSWKTTRIGRACIYEKSHCNRPAIYSCRAKGIPESNSEAEDTESHGPTLSELCDVRQVTLHNSPALPRLSASAGFCTTNEVVWCPFVFIRCLDLTQSIQWS